MKPVWGIALVLVLLLSLGASCKKKAKKASDNPVPNILVDMTLYPNDPLNFKVQSIGGWMYVSGGINGIILYRKSEQEFIALERTSPHLPDNAKAKAYVMPDNFTLRDSISGSRWRMFDGSVVEGPSQWGLRLYGTVYDGNALRIRNQ